MEKISTKIMSIKYLVALGFLAVLSITSYIFLQINTTAQRSNAAVVNVSGRQRMLSQRIALKARHLVYSIDTTERKNLRDELLFSINLMEQSHNGLLNGNEDMDLPGNPSPGVRQMFYSPLVNLDLKVRKYLVEAKALAGAPASGLTLDNSHLQYIIENSNDVLFTLDSLVRQYQKKSEADVDRLGRIDAFILISILAVLFMIALFLFRPMVRRIQRETSKLERIEERSRTIMEMVGEGVITINERGTVESFNLAAEQIFGYYSSQVIGNNVNILVPEPHHSSHDAYIQNFMAKGDTISGREVVGKRSDGSTVPIELYIREIKLDKTRLFVCSVRDITERKKMEKNLSDAAITDAMTGLLNRRGFLTLAEQQFKIADRNKRVMLLFYMDLDNMKEINDKFGHREGDRALIDTAVILGKTFRKSEIIARIGGDEFAMLMTEPPPDVDKIIISHIMKNFELHNKKGGKDYELFLSLGIARYDSENPCTLEDLMNRADEQMYQNKKKKNNITL